jgi:hypothetical protein
MSEIPWLEPYFVPEMTEPLEQSGTCSLHNIPSTFGTGPGRQAASQIVCTGLAPDIDGILDGDALPGRRVHILASGGPVVIVEEGSGSAAENRISTGEGNVEIPQGAAAWLVYDLAALRWRLSIGGARGTAGIDGINAFTTTSSSFTQPASSATVTVQVASTAWMGVGQYLYIAGGGYYSVSSITNSTHVVVTNLGYSGNASPSSTVAGLAQVTPGGLKGVDGIDSYTTTTSSFTQPAVSSTVTVQVASTAWMGVGQYLYVENGGYYTVSSITDSTHVVLSNLGYSGSASPSSTVAGASKVSPGGQRGVAGIGGLAAYATTAANFTQPSSSGTVSVQVDATDWMATGEYLYIAGGGYYTVSSITDSTHVVLTNLGYSGNASPSSTVTSPARVTPGGIQGATGATGSTGPTGPTGATGSNAYTTTSSSFTQPASAATVSVQVGDTSWMAVGEYLYVENGGYYTVSSITDSTHVVVTNLGYTGNASPGATVASSSKVSPGGIQGATGATGPSGSSWTTALDLDFTAESSQTLSSDTTYTIGGKTWTKRNSTNDNVAMAVTHGTGLVIQPKSTSDWNGATYTLPLIDMTLSQLSIPFGARVRIWVYISSQNITANFDNAAMGITTSTGAGGYKLTYGRGTNVGYALSTLSGTSTTTKDDVTMTLGSSNNVSVLLIPNYGMSSVQYLTGQYSAGFPAETALDLRRYIADANADMTGLTTSNAVLMLGALRAASGTSLSITMARLKVEWR